MYIYIYVGKDRERESMCYSNELAPSITEAEKPHDLLSASWRPGIAAGIIPVQV